MNKACHTAEYCYNHFRLCSVHFEEHMFANIMKNRLEKFAIPTLFATGVQDIPAGGISNRGQIARDHNYEIAEKPDTESIARETDFIMAKKRKQILTEKPPPNVTTITRKSKRRRKPKVNSNLIQITQHNMNLRPKKKSVLLGMPNERSATCVKDKNYGLNIEVTCSPSNNNTINSKARRKRKKKRDRTIGESTMFKTIDVARADDDANSDVVFVDDGQDEVIYVADDSTKQDLESPNGEESVIVIDDDSNVENVTNTNQILAGPNTNKPLTKTPTITYVRSKDGLIRPSRWNHLRIGNNNNHGNKKCNVPNLSPITVVNRQQARIPELPTLATLTPARDLASPGYRLPKHSCVDYCYRDYHKSQQQ